MSPCKADKQFIRNGERNELGRKWKDNELGSNSEGIYLEETRRILMKETEMN